MGMMGMGRGAPSLFGNNAGCASGGSLFGGRGLFGGRDDHHNAGQHTDGAFGSHGSDHHGADQSSSQANGTGFPAIPADTSGVTFYIDLNGDGVTDKTMSLAANNGATSSGGQSLQNYYDKIVSDLKVSDPGADPSKIVIKVTAYSPSQGQLNFHLTGNESQSNANTAHDHDHHGHDELPGDHSANDHSGNDHAHNDGHHGSNNDHAGNDHAGNDHASNNHHSGSEEHASGHDDADFYQHLCSNESGSHGDSAHDDHEDHHDDSHGDHGLMFC